MEMKMRIPLYLSPKLVALAFGSLVAFPGIALADSPQRFTFPDAEFMRGDEGIKAAKSFVETQLTPGLAMDVAVAKVENAVAACETPSNAQATINCEYYITARPTGGSLGENIWSVKLIPGPNGTLQNAIVERSRAGMPGLSSD
jgi:hypothetical protein